METASPRTHKPKIVNESLSKEISAILGAQTILIWTYESADNFSSTKYQACKMLKQISIINCWKSIKEWECSMHGQENQNNSRTDRQDKQHTAHMPSSSDFLTLSWVQITIQIINKWLEIPNNIGQMCLTPLRIQRPCDQSLEVT